MGFPKYPDIQEPRQDIWAWRMDVGGLSIPTGDMERCPVFLPAVLETAFGDFLGDFGALTFFVLPMTN